MDDLAGRFSTPGFFQWSPINEDAIFFRIDPCGEVLHDFVIDTDTAFEDHLLAMSPGIDAGFGERFLQTDAARFIGVGMRTDLLTAARGVLGGEVSGGFRVSHGRGSIIDGMGGSEGERSRLAIRLSTPPTVVSGTVVVWRGRWFGAEGRSSTTRGIGSWQRRGCFRR